MIMLARCGALVATLVAMSISGSVAHAQQITLRVHQFLPAPAPIPSKFILPWAKKVEEESNGRIKVEIYNSMQLGGTPPQLYDQARDGVADIVWTLPGYTAGRFPKSEVFELPFIAGNGEQNSPAAWEYYQKYLQDEFKDVRILAVHTHGPGLIHAKGQGVHKLEDLKGLKLRAPTRVVNKLIASLGATPVGMPVPAMPDALQKGVIDGAVVPWEVTTSLRVAELVNTHTSFSGNRSLYVTLFIFAMNKAKYESLPPDLKKVIDDNSGPATSKWAGKVMDDGDVPGREAAIKHGNTLVTLDAAETARWKKASEPLHAQWVAEMVGKGINGQLLLDDARAMITKYAGVPK